MSWSEKLPPSLQPFLVMSDYLRLNELARIADRTNSVISRGDTLMAVSADNRSYESNLAISRFRKLELRA